MIMDSKVVKAPKLYQPISMAKAKKTANELMNFVKVNNLSTSIAGKQYMYVEAWQFVGETQMGLTQVVTSCDPVKTDDEKEVKYKAVVEIFNNSGTVISRGFAFCSNKETKKKSFDEYAIASMAQTRAIGKAYRNILAWLVRMAGYEATPAEEINPNMRENLEAELSEKKAEIFEQFTERSITDSQQMIEFIKRVIGKSTITTVDEANKVLEELSKDDG